MGLLFSKQICLNISYAPTCHQGPFVYIPFPLHAHVINAVVLWIAPTIILAFAKTLSLHSHVHSAILLNVASMGHLWKDLLPYSVVGCWSLVTYKIYQILFIYSKFENALFYPITKKSGRCVSLSAFFSNPSNMWTGKFSGNFELTFHVNIWNLKANNRKHQIWIAVISYFPFFKFWYKQVSKCVISEQFIALTELSNVWNWRSSFLNEVHLSKIWMKSSASDSAYGWDSQ